MKKQTIYEMVTERILNQMKQGLIPWRKPWSGTVDGAISHASGKSYSLLNQCLLGKDGEWLTYKEIQNEGGKIRKGEPSSYVVFWTDYRYEEEKEDGSVETHTVPVLRYYNVWHIDQTEGIAPKWEAKKQQHIEEMPNANSIAINYFERETCTLYEHKTNTASYSPSKDRVQVPSREQFEDIVEFYSTLFHEMVHSTGHATRLNRKEITSWTGFGSHDYSKEELVAELGASFLCAKSGIENKRIIKNSTAYLQSWLRVLKNDPKMIIFAASKAEAAAKYILNEKGCEK